MPQFSGGNSFSGGAVFAQAGFLANTFNPGTFSPGGFEGDQPVLDTCIVEDTDTGRADVLSSGNTYPGLPVAGGESAYPNEHSLVLRVGRLGVVLPGGGGYFNAGPFPG